MQVIFFGPCAVPAHKAHLLPICDMKQDRQKSRLTGLSLKMKAHSLHASFILPPTDPHERGDLHNEPIIVYLLLFSVSEG